jgi:hypothetical protein
MSIANPPPINRYTRCLALAVTMAATLLGLTFSELSKADNMPNIHIVRGAHRDICQDIYQLLTMQSNQGYLYSPDAIDSMSIDERLREWKTDKSLRIPENNDLSIFREPIWRDVNYGEISKKVLLSQKEKWGSEIDTNTYRLQFARIDMNNDGVPELVYRSSRLIGSELDITGYQTSYISIYFGKFEDTSGLHLRTHLALYKDNPVFITRDISLSEITVTPAMDNSDIYRTVNHHKTFRPSGCTFSTEYSVSLED